MSALEIVMVAVAGGLVLLLVAAVLIWMYYKRLMRVMASQFRIYNRYARSGGVVFLGDSLTDFFPIGEYFPDVEAYNRGIAGNTTLQVLERLDDVVVLEPRTVFLQIGVNDILRLSRKTASPQNLTDRILHIAAAFPNAKVYVSSLYPINRKRTAVSKLICFRATNKRIAAVNAVLQQRCDEAGFDYIDMYPHLLDEKGRLKKAYTLEGLHLTAEGYCVIADVYRPYLDEEKGNIERTR